MNLSESIGQTVANDIAVSDYSPLPGQVGGLLGLADLAQVQAAAPQDGLLANIVKTAKIQRSQLAAQKRGKIASASRSPTEALRLAARAKKTAAPGSNVQNGIFQAMQSASKDAMVAIKKREEAKKLLAQGDKRAAAAASVQYLTAARKAVTSATRADKTKTAVNLDIMAKTLDEAGKKAQSAAQIMIRKTGQTPETDRLMAVANQMADNVKKLRSQSAAVQATPDEPEGLPSPQRIAEVANKFNIRTSMKNGWAGERAMVSVLSDAMDSALAQATDYDGAVSYYGGDMMGRLAADIEYGNYDGVLNGLGESLWDKIKGGVSSVISKGSELVSKAANVYKDNVKPLVDKAASAVGLGKAPPAPSAPPAPAPAPAPAARPAASSQAITMAPSSMTSAPTPDAGGYGGFLSGKMPWIIGGVAAAGIAAYFLLRPKSSPVAA